MALKEVEFLRHLANMLQDKIAQVESEAARGCEEVGEPVIVHFTNGSPDQSEEPQTFTPPLQAEIESMRQISEPIDPNEGIAAQIRRMLSMSELFDDGSGEY